MSVAESATTVSPARRGDLLQLLGEHRANTLRVGAIGALYAAQLIHYHFFADGGEPERRFHQAATAVAVALTFASLGVLMCLRSGLLTGALKWLSTLLDVVLLTALTSVTQAKANSPLALAFYVVLTAAALRFHVGLIAAATVACGLGYMALVGMSDKIWFDEEHAVEPIRQMVMLISLALCGLALGQLVHLPRQARLLP